eukprot:SAG31_NODE_1225_length_9271_cov_10.376472_2_plen_396_part_00
MQIAYANDSRIVPKPWVSYGDKASLVLNWLPPGPRFDPTVAPDVYCIQQRNVDTCDSHTTDHGTDSGYVAGTVQQWVGLKEPHTGAVPAHTIRQLDLGNSYQFRVGVLPRGLGGSARDGEWLWSEPSDAYRVGYANFTDASSIASAVDGEGSDGFTTAEMAVFMQLTTPAKVQDYLDSIPMNHETQDDTCFSALEAVRQNCAHCIEGAMLGAFILSLHGHPAYLCDMRACSRDDDHNVAVFQQDGHWGCLSVSNHASLRWRNPIYRTLRELMMSFFDDYMNNDGERTLRSYSYPVNLQAVFGPRWATIRGDVFHIAEFMDTVKHYKLCNRSQLVNLRPADPFMMQTSEFMMHVLLLLLLISVALLKCLLFTTLQPCACENGRHHRTSTRISGNEM